MTDPKPRAKTLGELPEKQRNDVYQLAIKPLAKRLSQPVSSAAALLRQTRAYIAAAQETGAPPETWMVERQRSGSYSWISPPLFCFYNALHNGSGHAKAAEALLTAGCSLWARSLRVSFSDGEGDYEPLSSDTLAGYIMCGSDSDLRSILLRAALTDPSAPKSFIPALRRAYEDEVFRASPHPGVWSSWDERARLASSFLIAFEPELLAASQREGGGGARIILNDAKKRAAAKLAPSPFDVSELERSLTIERRARLESLALLISERRRDDPEAASLLLEATPWLKETPNLACLPLSDKPSLFATALSSGSSPILEWLERAGANLYMAAAQSNCDDGLEWVLQRLPFYPAKAPAGFDFGPLGRMLFNGARALGPRAPAQVLKAVAKLSDPGPLLAAVEGAALAHIASASVPAASPAPRRRSL